MSLTNSRASETGTARPESQVSCGDRLSRADQPARREPEWRVPVRIERTIHVRANGPRGTIQLRTPGERSGHPHVDAWCELFDQARGETREPQIGVAELDHVRVERHAEPSFDARLVHREARVPDFVHRCGCVPDGRLEFHATAAPLGQRRIQRAACRPARACHSSGPVPRHRRRRGMSTSPSMRDWGRRSFASLMATVSST